MDISKYLKKYEKEGILKSEEKFNHLFFKADSDILIISLNKKELNLKDFEKKIGNPIQLHLYSNKDIELMKIKNKELLNNFINGIILSGYWELFK